MGTDADFHRRRIRNPTSVPNFPLPQVKDLDQFALLESLYTSSSLSGLHLRPSACLHISCPFRPSPNLPQ